MSIVSCAMDGRVSGGCRLEFTHPAFDKPMAFFRKYIDVIPNASLVWTNAEEGGGAETTVTFEKKGGKTLLVMQEALPTKKSLDASIEGSQGCMPEQFEQLDEMLVTLSKSAAR